MIVSQKNLELDTDISHLRALTESRQNTPSVSRWLAKVSLLLAAIAIAQLTSNGLQASAQAIFRSPQQSRSSEERLQLTAPSETGANEAKMAPIRMVGSGEGAVSRFQLPQAEPARGFLPPGAPSSQTDLGNESRIPEPELREVGANGSFLPAPTDNFNDQSQPESTMDLPGLDLSAMGLDLQAQQDAEDRSADPRAGGEKLEQLPAALGRLEVPGEQDREPERTRREQVIENYSDGKPRLLRTVALDREGNYYNDGPWVVKDRDGKVVAAGTYRKGVMQGQWARRHTSAEGGMFSEKPFTSFQGPFDSMANFKGGKLDGQWIVYDRAKRSIFEIGYEDGKRNGLATWFYPDTTKMRQATFNQGALDGEVSEWDEDGRLVSKEFYAKGRKLIRNTSFYRPKVPKEESYFLDVKLRQDGLDNWWDAKPAPYLASGKRIQNGQARAWYSNRQLQYQGQFRDDKPVGRFFWWHENGNRSTVGQFNRAGDRDGRWVWWHDNGMKRIEGYYKDDQPSGVWRSWDRAGKLIKSKDYDNLSDTNVDDQDNPLRGLDPREEEELLEGTVKTDPDEASSADEIEPESANVQETQDDAGLLPLPQGDPGVGSIESLIPDEGAGPSEPAQGQQFESLPPAIEFDTTSSGSIDNQTSDDGFEVGSSIMHGVGVNQEHSIVDRQPWGGSVSGDFDTRSTDDTSSQMESESTLVTEEVVDEAVEPFDLSELFE